MDKALKKIIDETIQDYFNNPAKMIEKGIRQETYEVCPHCKQEIYEKHEYTDDGGKTWRHSDCKGLIVRPPLKPSELAAWEKFLNPLSESELPLSGEKKYSKQEPGGQMAAVNTNEATFRIYNDTLCPDLWDSQQHLDPEVRSHLLQMAYDFYKKTKFVAPILDVYLMGSIANYNWTPDSDADVHVIIDFSALQMPGETASKVAKSAGAQWNSEHNAFVKGHKVEINIQSVNAEKPHVTGIYSLVKDAWIRRPSHLNVKIDKGLIQAKYSEMKKYLEDAIATGNQDRMKDVKEYLDMFRQYGLDNGGELSVENIVYKILRAKGIVKKLKDSIIVAYDKKMSVTETDTSDDEDYEEAMRYFSVGQEDDENVDNSYCWIWSKADQAIKSAKGGTHSLNFGVPHVKDYTYSGWFDPSKNAISVVFPKHERDKLPHPPTVNDIPSQIYNKLVSKFNLQSPRFEIFESFSMHSMKDYIGGIVDGEVRAEPVPYGRSRYYVHRDFPGLYSGHNTTNWRYNAEKNQVVWNLEPDPADKPKVSDFLEKRGIKNVTHKALYTGLKEISQKDISAKFPLPNALYKGDANLKMMTLGNLKSMRDKTKRTLDDLAYRHREDPSIIQHWQDQYAMYDDEIKRRLKYINAPVMEYDNRPDLKKQELDDYLGKVTPDNIFVTVQNDPSFPQGRYVQIDGSYKGANVFSSNPDSLRQAGMKLPSTEEFYNLPQGKYRLPDALAKIRMVTNEVNWNSSKSFTAMDDFEERRTEQMCEIASFLKDKPVTAKVPWKTISASLITKTWLIFGKRNYVNENAIDKIADQILTNIVRLYVSNEFTGHSTNYHMREEVADSCGIEFTEKEWDRNTWRFDNVSDYGMEPLQKIYDQIFNANTPEEKLYACDKALNVVHQRSDLAAMFVEGGTSTLTKIALQGGYNAGYGYGEVNKMTRDMKEGYGAGIPETDRLHIPGHRWQIRSKDAPKTPKLAEDEEKLINSVVEKLVSAMI